MEITIFTILLFVCILSLLEDRIQKYNYNIYIIITITLIFISGFREVGVDRDSNNYEYYFSHYDDPTLELSVELSFRLLSNLFYNLFHDVHSIFLFYAFIGITLKMYAFRQLSTSFFLPVAIYLGYYYILHDLTQIRAAIVSGLILCIIPLLYNGQRKAALALITIGCFFHYSTVSILPAIFLNKREMDIRERWIWAAIIPIGYLTYFSHFNIFTQIYIPYITDKIEIYETLRDKGLVADEINVFNLVFIVKCLIYLYVLYFYDTIKQTCKYLPIILRFMGISIFVYLFFAQLPVLSFRIGELYGIVEILIFTYIVYTIRPHWLGSLITCFIAISLFIIYIFIQKILETI